MLKPSHAVADNLEQIDILKSQWKQILQFLLFFEMQCLFIINDLHIQSLPPAICHSHEISVISKRQQSNQFSMDEIKTSPIFFSSFKPFHSDICHNWDEKTNAIFRFILTNNSEAILFRLKFWLKYIFF